MNSYITERFSPFFIPSLIFFCRLTSYSFATTLEMKRDESALLTFKAFITSDPHNMLKLNWSTRTSVCSWIGVTCDSHGTRVTRSKIPNMELVGSIPPEIGNLDSLVSLDISGNHLHGPIAASVFNMSVIDSIILSNTNSSGRLPEDICRHNRLQRLKILDLSLNNLEGDIPLSLAECPQLETVEFSGNSLSGHVPREIGNMTRLK
ncbi:probable inactive leucine-rich repeat receptor-like protein kinase At1g66830 [Salvia splendens]|uniref:probable inactive leucine-rich repeat receptor-like protein kinase At1g66830 n=1 Tax=Salvia splendens TaxID=180675 RepID=UPI001C269651|nr:probable inactive leucine-rich repeat receptor-like protein kinase At1g66830 [Salvia splendens]